ncbi:MAG: hypothetical protein IJ736_02340 [Firmicutes bacterium]|nr:hypothetical protein [Bacillota bacterium]
MNTEIKRIYDKLELLDYGDFYKVESDFLMYFWKNDKMSDPIVNTFSVVSNWHAMSQRSGVWTFYEATGKSVIQSAVEHLKGINDTELAAMIEKGIHDYGDPIYQENFDYPQEWIDEADIIDDWIGKNEEWLLHWYYDYLIRYKEQIMKL